MVERGNPETVVCDATGPAASLLPGLETAGVNVETVTATEHGQACGRLVDMVNERTLAHLGSAELRDAIRGAKSRTLGDAWAWSRRNSSVDISPLVAATLALWGTAISSESIYETRGPIVIDAETADEDDRPHVVDGEIVAAWKP
jgi:hypothetical protein